MFKPVVVQVEKEQEKPWPFRLVTKPLLSSVTPVYGGRCQNRVGDWAAIPIQCLLGHLNRLRSRQLWNSEVTCVKTHPRLDTQPFHKLQELPAPPRRGRVVLNT